MLLQLHLVIAEEVVPLVHVDAGDLVGHDLVQEVLGDDVNKQIDP